MCPLFWDWSDLVQLCVVFVVTFALALSWFAWTDPLPKDDADHRQKLIKHRVWPLPSAVEDWESLAAEMDGCAVSGFAFAMGAVIVPSSRRRRHASCLRSSGALDTSTPPLEKKPVHAAEPVSTETPDFSRQSSFEMLSLQRRLSESEPSLSVTRLPSVCEVSAYGLREARGAGLRDSFSPVLEWSSKGSTAETAKKHPRHKTVNAA